MTRLTRSLMLGLIAADALAMRTGPVRMLGVAGPALLPKPDGMRRKLSTTGSPVPEGSNPPPEGGWFDGKLVGSPVVKRFSDEMHGDRWMMWYSGRSESFAEGVVPIATGCVGLAQSKDGIVWEKLAGDEPGGACLGPNDESWWGFDTSHVGVGDVHVFSSRVVQNNAGLYWMYFFGGDKEENALAPGGTVGAAMSIGVALSNDGVHWGRVEGEHSSGAVLEPREGQLFVGWPQVIMTSVEPEQWRMYFHALNTETKAFEIGLATSSDGMLWEHSKGGLAPGPEGSFDAGGVSARCVLKDPQAGGGWLMYYEAQDAARRHTIGLARSADGVTWERGAAPVFEPGEDTWDGAAVARPWMVPLDDGSAMLYYLGRGEGDDPAQGIGVARSDGKDWSKWERVGPDAVL